jgi:hypothetical protein
MVIIAKEHDEIRQELEKYSYKTILDFVKVFPIKTDYYTVEFFPKQDYPFNTPNHTFGTGYIQIKSPTDFWEKWNRYKRLKAFL